jgi:hypothetical protein
MDRALTHVTPSSSQQRDSQPTGIKTDERGTHHHLQGGGTETRREGVRVMKKKIKSMNGPNTLHCNTLTGGRLLSMLRGPWREARGIRGERKQRGEHT